MKNKKIIFIITAQIIFINSLLAQTTELALQTGHTMAIKDMCFSPDEKILASVAGNDIILWETKLGLQLRRLSGHKAPINKIAFNHKGTQIASTSIDTTIIIWDIYTGKKIIQINLLDYIKKDFQFYPRNIIFSNDDKKIIFDCIFFIIVFDIQKKQILNIYLKKTDTISALLSLRKDMNNLDKNTSNYYSSFNADTIKGVWNNAKLASNYKWLMFKSEDYHIYLRAKYYTALAIDKNDSLIAFGDINGRVTVWNYLKNTSWTKKKHNSKIIQLDFTAWYLHSYSKNKKITWTVLPFYKHLKKFSSESFFWRKWKIYKNSIASFKEGKFFGYDAAVINSDKASTYKRIIVTNQFLENIYSKIYSFKISIKPTSIKYSNTGNYVAIGNSNGEIYLIDIKHNENKKLISRIRIINSIDISTDNHFLFAGNEYGEIEKWNLRDRSIGYYPMNTKPKLYEIEALVDTTLIISGLLNPISNYINFYDYSCNCLYDSMTFNKHMTYFDIYPQKKRALVGSPSYFTVVTHDKFLFNKKDTSMFLIGAKFNYNATKIITYDIYGKIQLIDINTGDKLAVLSTPITNYFSSNNGDILMKFLGGEFKKLSLLDKYPFILDALISKNDKKIFSHTLIQGFLWDVPSQQVLHIFELPTAYDFTPNSKKIIIGDAFGSVQIINTATGIETEKFIGHSGHIFSIKAKTDSLFISTGEDGKIKFWNPDKTNEILNLSFFKNGEWVAFTYDNYYMLSKYTDLYSFYFVKGLNIYTYDQFDIQFNRPDIILKRLGFANDTIIQNYKKAYYKRLEKLNISEKQFSNDRHSPVVEIINKDSIEITYNNNNNVTLFIKAKDTIYKLNRVNIWINNIPIYGKLGKDLTKKNINNYSDTVQIKLLTGKNKIQVSCLNEKFAESYKETIELSYYPDKPKKPNLYILGIGAGKYKNKAANIPNVVNDIKDFINLYKSERTHLFGNIYVDTLYNKNVTKQNILHLKSKLLNSTENDVVILYYSGHGDFDKNHNYYLLTYNVDVTDITKDCISYDEFENILDSIPARKRLLIVNACKSGEYDENIKIFKLMRETFPDIRKGTGALTIASSGAMQSAFVNDDDWNNKSAFGFALIDIFKKNKLLYINSLKSKVEAKVLELTDNDQKPTFRSENIEMNFRIK